MQKLNHNACFNMWPHQHGIFKMIL